MIKEFNHQQRLKMVGHSVLCILATAAAYVFFLMAYLFARNTFDLKWPEHLNYWIPAGLVLLVYVFGFIDLARGGGLRSYNESDLYLDFDLNSASGTVTDYYASQLTSSAYFLSQLFLCAPLQLIKVIRCSMSIINYSPDLDAELCRLLDKVTSKGKWHEASIYANQLKLLGYLINMSKIEFSPRKGVVKAA